MIRVALDARLLAYTGAGIARYVRELATAIPASGEAVKLTLLQSARDHQRPRWTVPLFTPPHHRFERLALALEMTRLRLHVAHFPDHIAPHRLMGRWGTVVTIHDLAFELFPETHTAESRRYYGQLRMAAKDVDAVIAVSEHTRQDILRLTAIPAERITTVYNGVSRRFRPRSPGSPGDDAALRSACGLGQHYLLAVGTLSPRKNLVTLLEAVAKLPNRHRAVELAVVGEQGWLYDSMLERLRALGLQDRVRLLGNVGDDELVELYRGASVFVFPSLYEGFALPPLEAMACGTPVIAANAGSIPEVVGGAALLVPSQDAAALASAITDCLDRPELRELLRARGLTQAVRFSWERCARETVAVYSAVAAR